MTSSARGCHGAWPVCQRLTGAINQWAAAILNDEAAGKLAEQKLHGWKFQCADKWLTLNATSIIASSIHVVHLCISGGGTLKVNSFFNHPSTFFQPSFTHFSTLGHFNKKEESQLVHQASVLTLRLSSEDFDCVVSDLSRSSRVHPLEEPRYWWWKSSRGFAEWKAAGTDEYRQAVMRRRGSVH